MGGAEEEAEEAAGEEGEEGEAQPKADDIINSFRHVYVREVVREPRIKFQKVPRLGSYMAIPMIYNSCLTNEALEAAVADYQDVMARREE